MATRASLVVCGCFLGLAQMGCNFRDSAPPVPQDDGGLQSQGPLPRTGQPSDPDPPTQNDAGVTLDPNVVCLNTEAVNDGNDIFFDGVGGFAPSRGFAAWDRSDCRSPRLALVLSDGACALGQGQRLEVSVREADLRQGFLTGSNVLQPSVSAPPIEVRLTTNTSGRTSVWGNCAGSSGTVTLDETGTLAGDIVSGNLNAVLSPCDGRTAAESILLNSEFDLEIGQNLEELCPAVPAPF